MKIIMKNAPAIPVIMLLACLLPISTSLTNILVISLLLLWLCTPQYPSRLLFYRQHPLTPPILLFLLAHIIGLIYSPASWYTAFVAIRAPLKLMMIPILAYYIEQNPRLKTGIPFAFIGTLCLIIIATLLNTEYNGTSIVKNHIVISYFMATALFFVLSRYPVQWQHHKILSFCCIGILAYYLFFLNTGRIGYVMLFLYLTVLAWDKARFKGLLLTFGLLALTSILAYHYSHNIQIRVDNFFAEWQLYQQGHWMTPIGSRFAFIQNSVQLFLAHPYCGTGTGSFFTTYQTHAAAHLAFPTDNPHNQYLYTAVELGLLGLVPLGWLFWRQWHSLQTLPPHSKRIATGFLFAFLIGCGANSWLKDHTETYFYCLMTACLFPSIKTRTLI